jgi:hypothetical protein
MQDRLTIDPVGDQVAGAEVWFVQQVPRRQGDQLASGSHASSPVRQGLGEDLEIIETLLQQLADYVSRWAPTARSDRRLHVEIVEPSSALLVRTMRSRPAKPPSSASGPPSKKTPRRAVMPRTDELV